MPPTPLAGLVRMPAPQHHGDGREQIGDRGEEAHLQRIEADEPDLMLAHIIAG